MENQMTDEYREQLASTFQVACDRAWINGWAFGFFTGAGLMSIIVTILTSG